MIFIHVVVHEMFLISDIVLLMISSNKSRSQRPLQFYNKSLYGKFSEFRTPFLSRFATRMLVIKAGIHKMLVRIANREDPDQTASSEAV